MPDIWMDVDIALAEVPVNIVSLIDDTDFKTRETGLAFNAAGMDLVWNFVTTGGAATQTAVTPTSGGSYDWTHQGDGMYTIEIPASGGASINNDTEGFGWFTGIATGVLPWRGPVIGFRASALNDSLVDAGTTGILAPTTAGRTLDVSTDGDAEANVTKLLGTAWLTPGTAGTPDVNVKLISDDATAANNAEAFFDGTGYAGTGNVIPTVTNLTNLPTIPANWLTAAGIAADAGTEIAAAVWDRVLNAANHNIAGSAGRRVRQLGAVSITGGTAQAGASNSITLAAGESATNEIYDNNLIVIVGGTGAGQSRVIVEYNGTSKVATVDQVWVTNPDNTSEYEILADHQSDISHHGLAQAGAASTITLASTASSTDDVYVGSTIFLSTSTGSGQARLITDYDGTTKIATVSPSWTTNPAANSVYKIIPVGRVIIDSIAAGAITAAAIATGAIDADALAADAVAEIQSGLATAAALATVDQLLDDIIAGTSKVTPIDIDGLTFANMLKYIGATTQGKCVVTLISGDDYTYDFYNVAGSSIVWTSTCTLGGRTQPTRS